MLEIEEYRICIDGKILIPFDERNDAIGFYNEKIAQTSSSCTLSCDLWQDGKFLTTIRMSKGAQLDLETQINPKIGGSRYE